MIDGFTVVSARILRATGYCLKEDLGNVVTQSPVKVASKKTPWLDIYDEISV